MGNKIIYNGQEYAGSVVNDNSVGEFTSNNGTKMTTGNNERFNDYSGNTIDNDSNTSNCTVSGSRNHIIKDNGYNNTNIFVTGDSNTASGNNTFITGSSNTAKGVYSIAMGTSNNMAGGTRNVAIGGSNTLNNGQDNFVLGYNNSTSNSMFNFMGGSANIANVGLTNIIYGYQINISLDAGATSGLIVNNSTVLGSGINIGGNNTYEGSVLYSIINGTDIDIASSEISSSLIVGHGFDLDKDDDIEASIIAGSGNSGSIQYSIEGGEDNSISTTRSLVGGYSNVGNITDSVIVGSSNTTTGSGQCIITGTSNQVYNYSNSIISGDHVYAAGNSGCTSNIISGNGIKVLGSTIKHNIINGYANNTDSFRIDGAIISNYINGFDNIIQGSILNNIIAGAGNRVMNSAYSLIVGQDNTLFGGNYGWYNTTIGYSNTMSQLSGYQNAAAAGDPQSDIIIGGNNYIAGIRNTAIGMYQCIVGQGNVAIGQTGNGPIDSGEYDTAFKSSDRKTFLDTYYPVAVPTGNANSNIVEGHYCYKEGNCTILGYNPGNDSNQGLPLYVHMEGFENVSIGSYNHIEGWGNLGNCADSHVEGRNNVMADTTTGLQDSETIDDPGTTSKAGYPYNTQNHLEGLQNRVLHAMASHVEGSSNKAVITSYNHIEGYANTSLRDYNSHIEGSQNAATNTTATLHIEGTSNKANGGITCSHIEGNNNTVRSGINYVHVEGCDNVVDNQSHISHAEGDHNIIGGSSAVGHIEGQNNTINQGSQVIHIEGRNNITSSNSMYAHAEGWGTQIQGRGSHAQNIFTVAKSNGQTAIGIANEADMANAYALIVGNGSYAATSLLQYSESSTYNTDDEVIYNGKVYKCLEDGVTGEWDSTKWDLENTEIIDGQEISRSNAMTVSWTGVLNVSGVNADIQINGNSIATGGDIANPNISDAYSNSSTYSIGNYCIYNNILYKCNTAISVAEDFDSSKWTQTTIGAELLTMIGNMTTLANRITALETALNGYSFADIMTQAEYDQITPDEDTIYPIVG